MPGTTWPVNGHPPGSSRDYPPAPVLMPANLFRHVNGCNARLPDPRLTREPGLFPHRSPRQSSTNAAVGGLKPPPAGRLQRANNPSSPAQHRPQKLSYHAPFDVRDTHGFRLRLRESRHCSITVTMGFVSGEPDTAITASPMTRASKRLTANVFHASQKLKQGPAQLMSPTTKPPTSYSGENHLIGQAGRC